METKQFSTKQILSILKERSSGASLSELARKYGVHQSMIKLWKEKYVSPELDISEQRRLLSENKQLKRIASENQRLRQMYVALCLDYDFLKKMSGINI